MLYVYALVVPRVGTRIIAGCVFLRIGVRSCVAIAVCVIRGHFAATSGSVFSIRRELFGGHGRVNVPDQRAQHWNALNNDGANDFGGVPDVRMRVTPEIPFVLGIAAVFPTSSNCGDDGDNHSQAHGQAETNLFDLPHV